MIIYGIYKNVQECDNYGHTYWITEEPLSIFYLKKDSAEKHIDTIIKRDLDMFLKINIKDSDDIRKNADNIRNNMRPFYNEEGEIIKNIYFVKEVFVNNI